MPSTWEMAGTEGTGKYVVPLRTSLGRIGYRELGGSYRLRLEPTAEGDASIAKILTAAAGWKQPGDGQDRYSKVVSLGELRSVLEFAIRTLGQGGARLVENPDAPSWTREVIDRVRMRRAVFISYRRSETQREVQRLYDGLTRTFEGTEVFRDIQSIPLGAPFPARLQDALNSTALGLVVIGPRWLSTLQRRASARGAESIDFVQLEVERLLSADIRVVPCLVCHATLPLEGELPESIRPLAKRQSIALRPEPDFDRDLERLFERLRPDAG
jgi:hypothetical protein